MGNHCNWLKRDYNMHLAFFCNSESKEQYTLIGYGQLATTKLRAATASVLSELQQTETSLSCFQLLAAMAVYPSNLILFPPMQSNYRFGQCALPNCFPPLSPTPHWPQSSKIATNPQLLKQRELCFNQQSYANTADVVWIWVTNNIPKLSSFSWLVILESGIILKPTALILLRPK